MPDDLGGPDPTIHRRRLRAELRRAREAAGRTQRETAQEMDWSMSKLIRIETGEVKISTNDLKALLTYYAIEADRIGHLIDVAKAAREQPRWAVYRDVASPEYLSFIGYESSAAIIRNFEPVVVPGLLQTEEYAAQVIATVADSPRVEPLVDLRIQRQEILFRHGAPECHFALDEAVLHRVIGGRDVMRRQINRIREVAELPHVRVRIVPHSAGAYPNMAASYVILEFADVEDEDVLYIENVLGDLVALENMPPKREKLSPVAYLGHFWHLEQVAPLENTPALLDSALDQLSG